MHESNQETSGPTSPTAPTPTSAVSLQPLLSALGISIVPTAPGAGSAALEQALQAVAEFLDASTVELWRSEPHGDRWRQHSWFGARPAPDDPDELDWHDLDDALPAHEPTLIHNASSARAPLLVIPLDVGNDRLGHLSVADADEMWMSRESLRALAPIGTLVGQLAQHADSLRWLGDSFDVSPLAMVVTDNERIVHANAAFARFLGVTSAEHIVGERLADLRHDDQPAGRRSLDGPGEHQFRHRNGSVVWGRLTSTYCLTPDERSLGFVQIEDRTEARLVRDELREAAEHDPLTGLVDRASFMAAIAEELGSATNSKIRLVLVNVDRIGSINATLGQPEGDRLLGIIAGRLHFATRADDVVSRLGGDQFAILLRGPATELEVRTAAQRLLLLLREPVELGGQPMAGSVSIGVASSGPTSTVESLLRDADIAVRHAKASGRNRSVILDEALRSAIATRSRIEGELRVALSGEQLELHYQPEVDLRTGEVLGVEALVRWPHPTMGLLSADAFVQVAEDVGLVTELGTWAIRRACQRLAAWSAEHPGLAMRVNVSAAQLGHHSLVDDVRSALLESAIDPARLCLEITETAVMTDVDQSMEVLEALSGLGLELAIDDFGTGFSSLAYLRRLPVEILKIDRSFVTDVFEPDGRAIVEAVLHLARSLDLEVIAEGIETDEQLDVLRALGCRRGQGHLFSAARSEPELLSWLASRS